MITAHGAIRDLPRAVRPREKLSEYGPGRLTNTELLAIILGSGKKGRNVLSIAENILHRFGTKLLPEASVRDLMLVPGIGRAKACGIAACFELARRLLNDKKTGIGQIVSPEDAFRELRDIRFLKKEHFVVLFLDTRNQEIKREVVSIGSLNASLVHPREVFEPAIKNLAAQVIIAHNHPSGDPEPSEDDLAITRRLQEAGDVLGIEVLDHIVVAGDRFLSFKEKGLMKI
ncbi:MAG: DNA repair protein RadC [Candidatus Omnitrophota bacterium]